MFFSDKGNTIFCRNGNEILEITAWGKNALRVRATTNPSFTDNNKALDFCEPHDKVKIEIAENDYADITNGKIRCRVHMRGYLTFYNNGKQILKEYTRVFKEANDHAYCMPVYGRHYKAQDGFNYSLTQKFEAVEGEKIFGMGQYQQNNFDLKGCVLELAQRNAQITIPFYVSNLGYGFLWNHPGIGEVIFGANYTQWSAESTQEIDYWITADDTPKAIIENYTEVTGRAPEYPEDTLGLWQSKLRYRTQDEVLSVAREYKKRGLPLDVIIIDYFHWIRQGDWDFDYEYWPDPVAMVKELKEMGVRCMVSVWPTVDQQSINYRELRDRGLLIRAEHGDQLIKHFLGKTTFYDATNPEARTFLWDTVKKNYFDKGIDLFWLDACEPELPGTYDYSEYRYYAGTALQTNNIYPMLHVKGIYEGQKAAGEKGAVSLIRSAWAGSQKYGALVWSGDVKSTFTSFYDQVVAGLHIGLSGIPWWSSDIGGFYGDVNWPHFKELLIRWFQFSTFSPNLRMHGFRTPVITPSLSDKDHGGGFCETGQDNELWSYGEEVYEILKKYLFIRVEMKDYIKSVMDEASENGSPVIRTMFYEFPDDENCWEWNEQYMFGSDYLVAPVLYEGMTERQVYLPEGKWQNIHTDEIFDGKQTITAPAPIDIIPVFKKIK
ncbi:MAG: family 31 glucosidase [Clostridia bacterium]|nr:family 31 glucosidase [Clostridia bacterium]